MTDSAVIALILARADAFAGAPRRGENDHFDANGRPFFEIAFPGAGKRRGAIGDASNPLWSEDGAFMCHAYVPLGAGREHADAICDGLSDLFLEWATPPAGLTIFERFPGSEGPRDVSGERWWGRSFGIRYRYQSTG
ncbi:hypothetical protein [Nisaea sediminum]|uniref:hypothetical protein n=1 Tax=Nisaea sediminum TaxID=2775867 RepID=UPI00186964BA|nr:hypothetical protein [Nisaea sediminum]